MTTESSRRHEPIGVNSRFVIAATVMLVGFVIVTLLGLRWLELAWRETAAVDSSTNESRQIVAVEPPLSTKQTLARWNYESQQRQLLSTYGWVDQSAGVARIPIERAMEIFSLEQDGDEE